jgi:hypothetical protein
MSDYTKKEMHDVISGKTRYTWGEIIDVIHLEEKYIIICHEYNDGKKKKNLYHPYFMKNNKWQDPSLGFGTLEEAIICAISSAFEGSSNSNAYVYIYAMLKGLEIRGKWYDKSE